VWQRVREEAEKGHQVYVVCPRISGDAGEEGERDQLDLDEDGAEIAPKRSLAAVEEVHAELSAGPLAGLRTAVLHGRLAPEEKDRTMRAFAAGEVDVLVSTTVIEVGVDVHNATTMVLLDADRFGVSQLHQLRGRVGRGGLPGLCLLVSHAELGSPARDRLDAVASTTDGFELSRVDLEQRREGDVLGASQSGFRSGLVSLRVLRDERTGLTCVVTGNRVSPILAGMPHPLTTPIMYVTEVSGSETNPCDEGENLCNLTWDQTGDSTLATAADWIVGKPSALLGLILIGLLVRWVLHRLIDRVVKKAEHGVLPDRVSRAISGGRMGAALNLREDPGYTRRVQRAATMGSLLKSIVTGVVLVVVTLMFIAELGYDIAPLIASAGIIGVAIGFGSQALVKDFLSGIFMIFEDQYGVGDEVDLGEAAGTVEAVSLRVTRLRDVNGTVWYVRNGEILRVGNMSQNWARTVLDVRVAYGEDLARVQRVLADVAHDLWEDEDFTGEVFESVGTLTDFIDSRLAGA
jgi:small conductance mechanosensitive channel